jgi:outer membrane receptor protein involved in Fe transport
MVWLDMPTGNSIFMNNGQGYSLLKGACYFDIAYRLTNLLRNHLDVTLTVTNIFDNEDSVGMAAVNGIYYPQGRSFGGSLAYKF